MASEGQGYDLSCTVPCPTVVSVMSTTAASGADQWWMTRRLMHGHYLSLMQLDTLVEWFQRPEQEARDQRARDGWWQSWQQVLEHDSQTLILVTQVTVMMIFARHGKHDSDNALQ